MVERLIDKGLISRQHFSIFKIQNPPPPPPKKKKKRIKISKTTKHEQQKSSKRFAKESTSRVSKFSPQESITRAGPPWWNSPCRGEGAYPSKTFQQSASTRRAQLSITATTVRFTASTDLLNCNVKTWVNTDQTRLERPSLVISTPLGVLTVRQYLPLCWVRTAPEELLWGCKLPNFFDAAKKVLDTEKFPQHAIADLNSAITFIVWFIQENPLQWKEINKRNIHTISCSK